MSAIIALATRRGDPADEVWLERATAISRDAGPDGQQTRWLGSAGLGHAMLQTGGERQGPQTLDGRTWITADARLDARDELVAALRRAHAGATTSDGDATLLLRAYAAWGNRLVDHITGDFAFAIWDPDAARLFCARDQVGVFPLHYARTVDGVVVASVLDALLDHRETPDTLDEMAIADFLVFGWFLDPAATAFSRVRQLPPAHRLVWSGGVTRIERYWRLPENPPLRRPHSIEHGAEALRRHLDAAVADRLTSTSVVAHLSGGMDSTSVAASALVDLRPRGGRLRAFTGVLGGDSGDEEGALARRIADRLGIPVDIADASTYPSIDPFATPVLTTPEPVPYTFTEFERQYAAIPARHARVALSGHGGDALFMFVPWYWVEWLARGHPRRVARGFAEAARLTRRRPRPHARAILRRVRAAVSVSPPPDWLAADLVARTGVAERWREDQERNLVASVAGADARALCESGMWSNQFRVGDPAFTRLPVRFRFPLVDLRLIAFVRSLPPDPWLIDKRILREASRNRLPAEVLARPKTPLVIRPATGLGETQARQLAELVSRCDGLDRFVDTSALRDELIAGTQDALGRVRRPRERALGLAHWLWHR